MYYLYHIPGKKIGVTRDLNSRVTLQQGYKPDEYEVLLTSKDIDYISDKEIELQKSYGYKVDIKPYKKLFNQMNIGLKWSTDNGVFSLDNQTIDWIVKNARTSMFNVNRCYIYNKAYANKFIEQSTESNRFDDIRQWARDKGIYKSGDARTQFVKLMEEAGELAQAILKNDEPEVIDAIGDMVVVLTNLAELRGYSIEKCIDSAYNVIKSRQGKMVNGTFVKQESL